jgi:signal transduction histidine kinase
MKHTIVTTMPDHTAYGTPIEPPAAKDEYYTPITAQIDLATAEVLPPRPDGVQPPETPDAAIMDIGRTLTGMFLETQKTTLAGMRLLDHRGITIGGRNDVGMSFAHVHEVREAMRGHYVSVIRQRISDEPPPPLASISRGAGIRIFIVYPVIHNRRLWGLVYMSRTPNNIMRDVYAERGHFILAGVTILTLTLILGLLTSLTISRPVKALMDRAKRMQEGDKTALQPLEYPGSHEIALLSRSFSEMARSLHQRSGYIRDFAAHVSHEFKTPLTAMQGAAELLNEHIDTMSVEERARFLSTITENTDRLKYLVTRLLELARADNTMPADARTGLYAVLERIQASYGGQAVKIVISGPRDLKARIPEEGFEIVASNLIANAVQHNARVIEIGFRQVNGSVEITFKDDGDGISERNRTRIFEPFFTTRRETGGTAWGFGSSSRC